jgi:type I restriction enzyme S subunit
MTNEQFLQQFGHFIDAPNGIQKLREMVLQLAVQGKLVEQDEGNKPALELMEQIKIEKAMLAAEGVIKTAKEYPAVRDDEIPYGIPSSWKWVRINEIGHNWGQKVPDSDFTYIDVSAINKEAGVIQEPNILTAKEAPSRARKIVKNGTVIYSTVRPYLLNIAVIDNEYDPEPIASTAFAVIHPYCGMSARYIHSYLRSPSFINYVESVQTGIAYPAINDKQFFSGLIPLPPLAEQHRIVAKVDELMALCDQLEAERNARQATHQRLIRAVHHPLTEASNTTGIEQHTAWHRIRDNFADLYTTLESVQALRQTILQIADQGKLVEQDPNDEHASKLLERISVERQERQKIERIKFPSVATITEEDAPYSLPLGWSWARLGQIIKISSGDGLTAKNMAENGSIPVFGGNGINGYHDKQNINEPTLVIGRVGFYCGSVHLTPEKAWVTDNAFITDCSKSNIYKKFLYWLLKGTNLKERDSATAQPVISGKKVYPLVVGVPPLEEQPRIVKKLEELLTLCDQLEANIRNKNDTATRYAEAIVQQIAAA